MTTAIDTPPASGAIYDYVLDRVRRDPDCAIRFELDCDLRKSTGLQDWLNKTTDENRELIEACVCAAVHVAYCRAIAEILRAQDGNCCQLYELREFCERPQTVKDLVHDIIVEHEQRKDPLYEGGCASDYISTALSQIRERLAAYQSG